MNNRFMIIYYLFLTQTKNKVIIMINKTNNTTIKSHIKAATKILCKYEQTTFI